MDGPVVGDYAEVKQEVDEVVVVVVRVGDVLLFHSGGHVMMSL